MAWKRQIFAVRGFENAVLWRIKSSLCRLVSILRALPDVNETCVGRCSMSDDKLVSSVDRSMVTVPVSVKERFGMVVSSPFSVIERFFGYGQFLSRSARGLSFTENPLTDTIYL